MDRDSTRLLVIDADPGVCAYVGDAAEELGFQVVFTGDPRIFREHCRRFLPTAIMLDLEMPEADGVELMRFLAGLDCRASIIVAGSPACCKPRSGSDASTGSTWWMLSRNL